MTKGELYNRLERCSGEFTVNAKSMIKANPDEERMILGDSIFTFDVRNALNAANKDLIEHLLKRPDSYILDLKAFLKWETELETKIFYWFGSLKSASKESQPTVDNLDCWKECVDRACAGCPNRGEEENESK